MKRLLVVSTVCMAAMLLISACSATPPQQASLDDDGPPVEPHAPRVLIFPFAPTGSVGAYDWIGRGIQQSLLADLSRGGQAQIVFPATQPGQGRVNPLSVAASADANVVVVGTYQVENGTVRITGELFDVGSGRNLGGIKATGPVTDLFKLEDDLDDQLVRVLPNRYAAADSGSNRVTPPPPAQPQEVPVPAPSFADNSATQPSFATRTIPPTNAPAAPPTAIPDTTYNYYNITPTTPPPDYTYEDPYYYPDYDDYPYYYGGWPYYGFVGLGVYPGFYGGYGFRGYHGYRGYGGYHGVEHPFYGGSRGGSRGGFAVGGGFHGGFGGGFHGGFGGGGHR